MAALLATLCCVLGFGPSLGAIQAPQVDRMTPPGGQRGTEVAVTLTGQRLFEPQGVLLEQPGLELLEIKADKPEQCTLRLRVAADCALGLHALRLRTAFGIGNLLQFAVGVLPEVAEQRTGDAPQTVPLGCTVNGSLRNEEIDRYAFAATAGTRVQCEAEGIRLGRSNLDLVLAVSGPDGRDLERADDSVLGIKDPQLAFTAPVDGNYVVSVRTAFADDTNAGGYRLHVGTFPRPLGCLPCGGEPGEALAVTLLEATSEAAAGAPLQVQLPNTQGEWFRWFPADARGTAPTPLLLRVGGPPNRTPAVDAQGRNFVEFPGSVHGVVAQPGQKVAFHWHAKKGVEIEFRAMARALRSPLDPVLSVRDAEGRQLADNDDTTGLDSVLRFNPPADGDYRIEVRDLLRGGSANHFFRLEGAKRSESPSLRLVVARREEAVLAVTRGNRIGAVLQWSGLDPKHELVLMAKDLPAGVTAEFGPVLAGTNLVPLLLTAAPDAEMAGSQAALWLRAAVAPHERDPGFQQVVPLVMARNDQPLVSATVRRVPVAVTQAAPFTLVVEPPAVPIVRGAPLQLQVRIVRAEGFTEAVRVRALWNPPGLSAGQVEIDGKADRGTFPLDASGSAMTGRIPIALVGQARSRGGSVEVCSDWIELQVDEPWLTADVGKVRTEAGVAATLRVQCKAVRPLTGACEATLLGLPRGVTCAAIPFEAAAANELDFALQVAADAAPGRHRGFLVQVRVPANAASGAPSVEHRFGGGEIRIDEPAAKPPAPANAGNGQEIP